MPAGRPTKYNREFHCENFVELSKKGKTLAQIAFEWDIDRDTVHEWKKVHKEFSDAVKKGRQYAEAWYMNIGQMAMLNQVKIDGKGIKVELGWHVWMTKNMFKWHDRQVIKDETEQPDRPLEDATDEEIDAL